MKLCGKAAAGSLTATVVGLITWLLVSYVPSFHNGLPSSVANFLPALVGVVLGAAAAMVKKESGAIDVGEEMIARVEAVAAKVEADVQSVEQAITQLAGSKSGGSA